MSKQNFNAPSGARSPKTSINSAHWAMDWNTTGEEKCTLARLCPLDSRSSVVNDRKLVKHFGKVGGVKPQAIELELEAPGRRVERRCLYIGRDLDIGRDPRAKF